MHVVIAGGTGQLGGIVARALEGVGHRVRILGRSVADPALRWDGGHTDGPWFAAIDGADVVINLAGRSVNCRYSWANLNEMMTSRVVSTQGLGRAIAAARRPPSVWLQASTASIYAHTLQIDQDESSGVLGGHEPDVPDYWGYSVNIARSWELALAAAPTPRTRKVAMRLGFTMSPDPGGVFDWLVWLVRRGLGGPFLGGAQYVSWLHDDDLVGAVRFLIDEASLSGAVNVTAPQPLPNRRFMRLLREAVGVPVGLPILPGMAQLGARVLRTDVELMEKSRRVVPERLLQAGYRFAQPDWAQAAPQLVARWRAARAIRAA